MINPFLIFIYNLAPENVNTLYIINAIYSSFGQVTLYFIALVFITSFFATKASGVDFVYDADLHKYKLIGAGYKLNYKNYKFIDKFIRKQKSDILIFVCVILVHYFIFFIASLMINIIFEVQYEQILIDDFLDISVIFGFFYFYGGIYLCLHEFLFPKIIAIPIQYYFWKIDMEY